MGPWIIYYADESTYTSDDGDWDDAPTDNVCFVIEDKSNEPGSTVERQVHMGQDYYFIFNGVLSDANEGELGLYGNPVAPNLKTGQWTSDEVWQRIHDIIFPPQ